MADKVTKLDKYVQCSQCGRDMLVRGPSAAQWCNEGCYGLWSAAQHVNKEP